MTYKIASNMIMSNSNLTEMEKHDICLELLELEIERVQESRREHINKNNLNKYDKKATV